MVQLEDLQQYLKDEKSGVKLIPIKADQIIFEERVKLNCLYCENYNSHWRCPGKLPELDYQKIIGEYTHLAAAYQEFPFTADNYEEVRYESSRVLHETLLKLEGYLFSKGEPMGKSFIAGPCKLCKECDPEKCRHPFQSRVSLEAVGCNVIKTMENIGIDVDFSLTDHLKRVGLMMW